MSRKLSYLLIIVLVLFGCSTPTTGVENTAVVSVTLLSPTITPSPVPPPPTQSPSPTPTPSYPLAEGIILPNTLQAISTNNIEDLTLIRSISFKNRLPVSAEFSPDGRFVAVSENDRRQGSWSILNEFSLCDIQIGTCEIIKGVKGVFSPDGNILAIYYLGEGVKLWKFKNGQLTELIKQLNDSMLPITFSPDGKMFGAHLGDNFVVYQMSDWSVKYQIPSKGYYISGSISISPNWSLFARADNTIRRFPDESPIGDKKCPYYSCTVAYSIDGTIVAAPSTGKNLDFYLVAPWKFSFSLILPCVNRNIIFSPNSELFVTSMSNLSCDSKIGNSVKVAGQKDGKGFNNEVMITGLEVVGIWNIENVQLLKNIDINNLYFTEALNFSPDGKILAIGTANSLNPDQCDLQFYGVP